MEQKKVVISSLIYKLLERFSHQGIAFVVQIILARILDPTDYGVLTILTIFITISQVFVQSGLNTALIQRNDINEKDFSTVFYLSLIIAGVLYLILFISSPFIAAFYRMPEIKNVLRVLAIILIPGAFNSIQNAKIAREMQFKKLLYSSLGAVIISGIVGIYMAIKGYGVWSLVGQQISNQFSICIILFFVVRWKPMIVFEFHRLKMLFSFGWKLLLSNLIDTTYKELRSLIIGKKYSPSTLGYYNRGKQFPELIVNNINGSIQSVMLPTLSKVQDNKERMKQIMRRSIVTSAFFLFPVLMGLAVVSESLIVLLLTEKWLPCVPYLRIYCFIFAFYPIHTANLQAINAQGRSDQFLKLEIIKKIYGIVVLFISVAFFDTPLAIALGGAITTIISCFVNASPNKRLLNYSYMEQLKDILPTLIITFIMGTIVYTINFLKLSNILTLILQVLVGIVVYIMLALIIKLESFKYLLNIIKSVIVRKNMEDKQGDLL